MILVFRRKKKLETNEMIPRVKVLFTKLDDLHSNPGTKRSSSCKLSPHLYTDSVARRHEYTYTYTYSLGENK